MKILKSKAKPKSTGRTEVVQAMAKQDKEIKQKKVKDSKDLQEIIRLKAYELYVERGGTDGNDADDWIAAERIVLESSR